MATHTLPQFQMDLPEGWQDLTAYVFVGPSQGTHQQMLSLTLDRQVTHGSLEEFGQERVNMLREAHGELDVLKDEIIALPSGTEAYEFVHKWVPSDGNILFMKMVCVLIGGVGYVFSTSFTKRGLKTVAIEVTQMIDSLIPIEQA